MFVLYYWGRVFKRIGLDIKDHYGWGVLPALFGVFGAGFYAIDQVRTVGLLAMFSEWLSFWHSLLYVGLPTFVVVIVILAVITPARITVEYVRTLKRSRH